MSRGTKRICEAASTWGPDIESSAGRAGDVGSRTKVAGVGCWRIGCGCAGR